MNKQRTLKDGYVSYYKDVPIQKYAAMAIGRDEDTIMRWRKEDVEFADAVLRAKAEWIRKKLLATKAEFALERLEKEVFSPSSTTSLEPIERAEPASNETIVAFQEFMLERTKSEYRLNKQVL